MTENDPQGQGPGAAERGRLSRLGAAPTAAEVGVSARLPRDTLADAKALAGAHPDGIVDLSVGTPSTRPHR